MPRDGDGCTHTCQDETCGDGIVQPYGADGNPATFADNEECDDGNLIDGDGCSAQCKNQILGCGDAVINKVENSCLISHAVIIGMPPNDTTCLTTNDCMGGKLCTQVEGESDNYCIDASVVHDCGNPEQCDIGISLGYDSNHGCIGPDEICLSSTCQCVL